MRRNDRQVIDSEKINSSKHCIHSGTSGCRNIKKERRIADNSAMRLSFSVLTLSYFFEAKAFLK